MLDNLEIFDFLFRIAACGIDARNSTERHAAAMTDAWNIRGIISCAEELSCRRAAHIQALNRLVVGVEHLGIEVGAQATAHRKHGGDELACIERRILHLSHYFGALAEIEVFAQIAQLVITIDSCHEILRRNAHKVGKLFERIGRYRLPILDFTLKHEFLSLEIVFASNGLRELSPLQTTAQAGVDHESEGILAQSAPSAAALEPLWTTSLFANVVGLAILLCIARYGKTLSDIRLLPQMAGILTTVGTLALSHDALVGAGEFAEALYIAGSLATGLGSGAIVALWVNFSHRSVRNAPSSTASRRCLPHRPPMRPFIFYLPIWPKSSSPSCHARACFSSFISKAAVPSATVKMPIAAI